MHWFISIPNPQQLVVLFQNPDDPSDGGWMLWEHKFPSSISLNTSTCSIVVDVPYMLCGDLQSFDDESFQYLSHITDGYRYGVYMASSNKLVYVPPHLWNEIPHIDYRGQSPYMLHV